MIGWLAKWSVDFSTDPVEDRPRVLDPRRPHPFVLARMRGTVLRGTIQTCLTIHCLGQDQAEDGSLIGEPEEFCLSNWSLDGIPAEAQAAMGEAAARCRVVAQYVETLDVPE